MQQFPTMLASCWPTMLRLFARSFKLSANGHDNPQKCCVRLHGALDAHVEWK